MQDTVVYVSGPYSDAPATRTVQAIVVGEDVVRAGGVPIVPHLSHLWHAMIPHDWTFWLNIDVVLVGRCDCVYVFAGDPSAGRDREVAEADRLGIPVFTHWSDVVDFIDKRNKEQG